MNPRARKYLSRLLPLGVTALCFWYLFHDLDLAALGEAFLALTLHMVNISPTVLFVGYSVLFEKIALPGGQKLPAAQARPCSGEADPGATRS